MLFEKQIEDLILTLFFFLGKELTTLNYLVENYFFFYNLDKY